MHPNPIFRQADATRNLAFARSRGFGILCVNSETGPLLSHTPFALEGETMVHLHLVRSNPILRLLNRPQPAAIAVSGPEGYISPDWYGADDQVPTWNYVAVHLRGTLEVRPQAELADVLDRLSAEFEARLAPKPPWSAGKMSPGVLARLMRMIVPCRLAVAAVEGTWKLGQNKEPAARLGAAAGLEAQGLPDLAELMRLPPA